MVSDLKKPLPLIHIRLRFKFFGLRETANTREWEDRNSVL